VDNGKAIVVKYYDIANEKIVDPTKDRLSKLNLPFQGRVVAAYKAAGNAYDTRIVKPREQILEMFREELARQRQKAKLMNGDPDKPLTIEAGLRAVVAAARARVKKEWETRVAPTVDRFRGKKAAAPEEEEEAKEEDEDEFYDDAE